MASTPSIDGGEPRMTRNRSNESTVGPQHPKSMEAGSASGKVEETHRPKPATGTGKLQVKGEEILPAPFTDHNAVVLRLAMDEPVARRSRAMWKMDPILIQDAGLKTQIRQKWEMWRTHKPYYPDVNTCWNRYVKKQLRQFLCRVEAERREKHKMMEDHLYQCIYDIQQSDIRPAEKLSALNR